MDSVRRERAAALVQETVETLQGVSGNPELVKAAILGILRLTPRRIEDELSKVGMGISDISHTTVVAERVVWDRIQELGL
ncbi:hypothetical protein ACFL2V_15205 [Pseudomonadota bacterium]